MKQMFEACLNLESLDLSNFKTINVENMDRMFYKCRSLKEIKGINNFNTTNVINMNKMFHTCIIINKLNLSNFNTNNVNNMNGMFAECFELEYLDLSNFNTSNILDMAYMFNKCYKLKEIKGINNFNIKKGTDIKGIFDECMLSDKFKSLIQRLNEVKDEVKNLNIKKEEMILNFISTDNERINCSLSCYNNDKLSEIEEKLCLQYPELKHKDVIFNLNGNIFDKSLTLEENNMKNGMFILVDENLD